MVPDRNIVRKIKSYDPDLYVKWNQDEEFFELWRKMEHGGHRLITPITRSIYGKNAPREYCDLDERILYWLHAADSWRFKSSQAFAIEADSRYKEFIKNSDLKFSKNIRDFAKDLWQSMNAHYIHNVPKKNEKPKFSSVKQNKWVRPDMTSKLSPRIMYRSPQNALRYGFKRK